jgi:hypothetical protein
LVHELRQAKVGEPDLALVEEDVGGFEVVVDDGLPLGVQVSQPG